MKEQELIEQLQRQNEAMRGALLKIHNREYPRGYGFALVCGTYEGIAAKALQDIHPTAPSELVTRDELEAAGWKGRSDAFEAQLKQAESGLDSLVRANKIVEQLRRQAAEFSREELERQFVAWLFNAK